MPFKIPTPLTAASEKRAAEGASTPASKKVKVPADSDLVALESSAKKPAARRFPPVAPLNICVALLAYHVSRARAYACSVHLVAQVYKVSDRASDLWSAFDGVPGASLWQMQMEHGARPGVLFGLRDSMNEFLALQAQNSDGFPKSIEELQKTCIRLVVAPPTKHVSFAMARALRSDGQARGWSYV